MIPFRSISRYSGRRQFVALCLCVLAVSFAATHAFHASARQSAPSPTRSIADARQLAAATPIQPYVATFEERVSSRLTGQSFISARLTEAVRADGAKVKKAEYLNAKGHIFSERRLFLPGGILVEITDDTKTIVAAQVAQVDPLTVRRLDPQSDCQNTFLGNQVLVSDGSQETILGFRAVHLKRTGTGSQNSSWEWWMLPDVGCLQARQVVSYLDSNGTVTDTSVRVLTSLRLEAPPPELFLVPKDYDQVSPSEERKRRVALSNSQLSDAELRFLQRQDVKYFSHRIDVTKLQ